MGEARRRLPLPRLIALRWRWLALVFLVAALLVALLYAGRTLFRAEPDRLAEFPLQAD